MNDDELVRVYPAPQVLAHGGVIAGTAARIVDGFRVEYEYDVRDLAGADVPRWVARGLLRSVAATLDPYPGRDFGPLGDP